MGRKNPAISLRSLCRLLLILAVLASSPAARAADLPLASSSPLVGFAFDDKPLLLPVQRNFQMAMLTASSELGRSCGRMEAYGWRMGQSEQGRVNTIFNSTVERLRAIGYTITAETPSSISHDITMFSADKSDRHFLFMWSAGEIGLVMTLCESTSPASGKFTAAPPMPAYLPPQDVVQSTLQAPPSRSIELHKTFNGKFSPIGAWIGSYVCEQGYTGGTFAVTKLKGQNFEGVFRFYPTPRNQTIPRGSYYVSGQYDAATQRIVINPGKWIERPPHYYNTVMVGSFDPAARSFSAFFQGIAGCTSFEAKYGGDIYSAPEKKKPAHRKKAVKKAPAVSAAPLTPVTAAPVAAPAAPAGTSAPNDSANVPAIALPSAVPDSTSVPAAVAPPAQTPPLVAPPAPAQTPPPVTPTPPPAQTAPPKKGGQVSIQPARNIVLAYAGPVSGQWVTPQAPQAPQARMVDPVTPMAPPAAQAPQSSATMPYAPTAPAAEMAQQAPMLDPYAPEAPATPMAPPANRDNVQAPQAPYAQQIQPYAPQAPPAQMVPDTGRPPLP